MRQIAIVVVTAAVAVATATGTVVVISPPAPIYVVLILLAYTRIHVNICMCTDTNNFCCCRCCCCCWYCCYPNICYFTSSLHNYAIVDCYAFFYFTDSVIWLVLSIYYTKMILQLSAINAISLPLHSIHSIHGISPTPRSHLSLSLCMAYRPVLLTESPVWKLQFTVFNFILDQLMNSVVQNCVRPMHVYMLRWCTCVLVYFFHSLLAYVGFVCMRMCVCVCTIYSKLHMLVVSTGETVNRLGQITQ